jgi:hypothetical protein
MPGSPVRTGYSRFAPRVHNLRKEADMPTRWIMVGLRSFAFAAAVALAVVAAAPIGFIRALGAFALAFSLAGMLWQAYLLRRYDPHAFEVLRYQADAWIGRMGMRWTRARHALARGAHDVATTASP